MKPFSTSVFNNSNRDVSSSFRATQILRQGSVHSPLWNTSVFWDRLTHVQQIRIDVIFTHALSALRDASVNVRQHSNLFFLRPFHTFSSLYDTLVTLGLLQSLEMHLVNSDLSTEGLFQIFVKYIEHWLFQFHHQQPTRNSSNLRWWRSFQIHVPFTNSKKIRTVFLHCPLRKLQTNDRSRVRLKGLRLTDAHLNFPDDGLRLLECVSVLPDWMRITIKVQKAAWHSVGNQRRLDLFNRT